jgi:hypothetical protein
MMGMSFTDVIAWKADASYLCHACAWKVYPGLSEPFRLRKQGHMFVYHRKRVEDREGNEVSPVFCGQEVHGPQACDRCHCELEGFVDLNARDAREES